MSSASRQWRWCSIPNVFSRLGGREWDARHVRLPQGGRRLRLIQPQLHKPGVSKQTSGEIQFNITIVQNMSGTEKPLETGPSRALVWPCTLAVTSSRPLLTQIPGKPPVYGAAFCTQLTAGRGSLGQLAQPRTAVPAHRYAILSAQEFCGGSEYFLIANFSCAVQLLSWWGEQLQLVALTFLLSCNWTSCQLQQLHCSLFVSKNFEIRKYSDFSRLSILFFRTSLL